MVGRKYNIILLLALLLAACTSSKTTPNDNDPCVGRCGMVGGVACGHCDYGYTCNTAQFCVEITNDMDLWTEEPEEDLVENDDGDVAAEIPVIIEEDEIIVDTDETVDADSGLIACTTENETRSVACGFNGNGLQEQICTGGYWVNTGPCDDPDGCPNGECQMGSMGTIACCKNGQVIIVVDGFCIPPGVAGCTYDTGCC